MLRNYLVVAWRNLWKSRGFSVINILGLAVGMAGCLLILMLIQDQDRRDEHHPHTERIYRVTSTSPRLGRYATSPGPLGPALERSAPGVQEVVRMQQGSFRLLRERESFSVEGLYAEASFLTVFDFPLTVGNPKTALADPYSIVLSQGAARRVFGHADPLGKTVTVETDPYSESSEEVGVFTVTGVLAETDTPSHLTAEVYLSFSTLTSALTSNEAPNDWAKSSFFGYYTYVLLAEKARPADVETQLNRIAKPYSSGDDLSYTLGLQPLTDIHLGPMLGNEMPRSGILAAPPVYFLSGLAFLILLAAGFNYANLSVARSLTRAREIGVRKTVGAGRGQVAVQFLAESVLVALIALLVALVLLQGLTPAFNSLQAANLFQTTIALEPLEHPGVFLLFVAFAVGVGLVAGAYPALYLARFDPASVLKGTNAGRRSSGLTLRKGLTVLQLGMALCFIISAVLLYRQAHYIKHVDYGFDSERLIYVNLQDAPPQAFKQQAKQLSGVESVSVTSKVPVIHVGRMDGGTLHRAGERTDSTKRGLAVSAYWIGADYLENMSLKMVAAEEQLEFAFTNRQAGIINEKAAHELGFASPAQAVGEVVTYGGHDVRVVGVVEDYAYLSPNRQLHPLLLRHDPERLQYALVRARPGDMASTLSGLRDLWPQFDAAHPLDYGIYEEALERMTAPMVEGTKLIGLAAFLAVFIACLGLLGIASYNVRTRTQEIGIRKALGASVRDVTWLLSKEYLGLVIGAGVLALPLAYWINRQWLTSYSYRIDIGWVTPVLCMIALLALALAVVGSQTMRAALTNPAHSLRAEAPG